MQAPVTVGTSVGGPDQPRFSILDSRGDVVGFGSGMTPQQAQLNAVQIAQAVNRDAIAQVIADIPQAHKGLRISEVHAC